MHFKVVQVIKSLQDPPEMGNNLPGINDNVREWGLEQGDSEVILFHIYASWSVDWTVGAGGVLSVDNYSHVHCG